MSNERLTIAVLGGTGKEGGGLALRWAHKGHRVVIGSRTADRAEEAAAAMRETLGADVIQCIGRKFVLYRKKPEEK